MACLYCLNCYNEASLMYKNRKPLQPIVTAPSVARVEKSHVITGEIEKASIYTSKREAPEGWKGDYIFCNLCNLRLGSFFNVHSKSDGRKEIPVLIADCTVIYDGNQLVNTPVWKNQFYEENIKLKDYGYDNPPVHDFCACNPFPKKQFEYVKNMVPPRDYKIDL